ncbi:Glutamine synthetase [Astathelohania contejeani]|uniref:Glutamine synthetase n=1 Tax=Astathelohania contejeani TaxID=164912 RepID=A0ABQ7HZ83_9MICR|nr:Glutamine synthetase [Thelohania contejeani]
MLRFEALKNTLLKNTEKEKEYRRNSDQWEEKVFNNDRMKQYLKPDIYKQITNAIKKKQKVSREVANAIADGMKAWAIKEGAFHFTHWFQPLNGNTAEKHDSFMEHFWDRTKPIETLSGMQLVQQESDASSFPNGGLRNTFEARGYTAWDPSSPAFIFENILCIPSVFLAYTGESLDFKIPLARSILVIENASRDVLSLFDQNAKGATPSLGWEQEFFLVDSALANARPDILSTGRTLIGNESAKGQQLDDHYFGSIPTRALNYLRHVEHEATLLGIPIKTFHNEVAPNQFEFAHSFERVDLSVDHNTLFMSMMRKIAEKHNLKVLLHEKPFKGVNGSGKHNNWSLLTEDGENLLVPGENPTKNLKFLTFFINIIKGIADNNDVLRSSVTGAGNDHRLGASEAPPAIMSVFIGKKMLEVISKLDELNEEDKSEDIRFELLNYMPDIKIDNTDRNRTSPFAFTGNKFEFRAVGSSVNCGNAMMTLNTIVANQLIKFYKDVKADTSEKNIEDKILSILKSYIPDVLKIVFEGDGYGKEWELEAEKRGLSNLKNTPEALKVKVSEKYFNLFNELKVLSATEIKSRYEIEMEEYEKKLEIEGKVLCDIARNHVVSAAVLYQNTLIENVKGLKEIFHEDFENLGSSQIQLIKEISEHVEKINNLTQKLIGNGKSETGLIGKKKYEEIIKTFEQIRFHCDSLEMIVHDEFWNLVKYRELLFTI